jgi:hypothetical protein
MRFLRSSGFPALFFAVLTAAAALLPEAGHSLAHRDHEDPTTHDHDHHSHQPEMPSAAIGGGRESGDHAHADLLATTPGKPLLLHAAVARVDVEIADAIGRMIRVSRALAHGLAPPEQAQAPPPPTRAPPLA